MISFVYYTYMDFFESVIVKDTGVELISTKNNNIALMNGLRRELMSGLDVYALHEENATMYSNISPFYTDFILKNRMALMPVKYESVHNRNIELHLSEKNNFLNPLKNNSQDILNVTLDDFQIIEKDESGNTTNIKPEDVFIFKNMTILWLRPGQQIHLKYSGFKKDNGYTHSMYQNFRIQHYSVYGTNNYGEPEKIKMVMTNIGKLETKTSLLMVLNNIITKLNNIKNNVIDVGSSTNIVMIDDHYCKFSVMNETFTVCNILKYYIVKQLHSMLGDSSQAITNFFNVSCNQVHPLKSEFIMQVQLYEPFIISGEEQITRTISSAIDNAVEDIEKIKKEITLK